VVSTSLAATTGFAVAGAAASCFASTARVGIGNGLDWATVGAAGLATAGTGAEAGADWARTGARTSGRVIVDDVEAAAGGGAAPAANCFSGATVIGSATSDFAAELGKARTGTAGERVTGVSAG
jgi:hypothetical protein